MLWMRSDQPHRHVHRNHGASTVSRTGGVADDSSLPGTPIDGGRRSGSWGRAGRGWRRTPWKATHARTVGCLERIGGEREGISLVSC